ncbi:MAG: GntR family transcriptional regulator [Solobacterium sp.]|nr:GntR family transcriptional regulator [Solobacterium sp.]
MRLFLNHSDERPIYEQIAVQIRDQVISGELEVDEPLPSIRNLARDLKVSVITTKRAYEELEKDGYIYTVAGKGCFVARKNTGMIRELQLREIEEHIVEIQRLSAACSLTKDDVMEMISVLWEK